MLYYSIVPWLMGTELPRNKNLDISFLTIPLMVINVISTLAWFSIYILYPFVRNKVINHQLMLIKSKNKYGKRFHKPLVSIIIPARNEESVIRKTVINCLQQTYTNIEVLVICHNSTDKTFEQADVDDTRVKVIELKTSQAGKGIALNFGVDHTNGEYICIIDSDGKLSKDFMENALPLFDEGYAAVQGKITASNRGYNIITSILALEGDIFSVPFMTVRTFFDKRTPLGGTGLIIRKDILIKEGKFGNALIDDFELSFRLYRKKDRIAFAPLSVVYDEKPPSLLLMFRQRSRWVKGHIDLLRSRIAEPTDIIGHIYWLSPIFILCGLISIAIISLAVIYYMLFGYMPYSFAAVPIRVWLITMSVLYVLQVSFIAREPQIRGLKNIALAALLIPFTNYWYAVLIRAFFVKSWANTKTIHGFEIPSPRQYRGDALYIYKPHTYVRRQKRKIDLYQCQ
jgi:cellulose synthase/poly-beta-1,6-N-acetylglucosamine synthase-like glycosyltransferase